jgi:hypothetical protein
MSHRDDLLDGTAWHRFCDRLRDLGDEILGDEYPSSPRDRAEGYRALIRKMVYATQLELEAGDPSFPTFVRLQDPYNQWGGPNPDNVYLRANIDPAATYRVWGDVRGVRQAIFSLHEGDMQLGEFGVYGECSLDQLAAPGGRLELFIAPQPPPGRRPGNCIVSDPKARIFTIRIYQSDWERDATPPFHIARVGNEGVPRPALEPAALDRALERAATWVEKSTRFWNAHTRNAWQRSVPNSIGAATAASGGADNIAYGNCMWELDADQALLITTEVPDADYWAFTLHTLGWLESGDFAERQTSLNHTQAHVDDDGMVRIVVAHRDPGIANWIDTEGRERGMLVYRWIWARSKPAGGPGRPRLPTSTRWCRPAIRASMRRAARGAGAPSRGRCGAVTCERPLEVAAAAAAALGRAPQRARRRGRRRASPRFARRPEALVRDARRASTGLDDFGDAHGWRLHYDVLLAALENESSLHLAGRLLTRRNAALAAQPPAAHRAVEAATADSPERSCRRRSSSSAARAPAPRSCTSCSPATTTTGRRRCGRCCTRSKRCAATSCAPPATLPRSSGTTCSPSTRRCTPTPASCPTSASSSP